MRAIRTLTVGLLTTATLIGLLIMTPSFAAHPDRVDVIGTLNEKVSQPDSNKNGGPGTRVDVIGRIRSDGPAYRYNKPTSH